MSGSQRRQSGIRILRASSGFWQSAIWDTDLVRDDLRDYVIEHIGDNESGVLIIDETSLFRRGDRLDE